MSLELKVIPRFDLVISRKRLVSKRSKCTNMMTESKKKPRFTKELCDKI